MVSITFGLQGPVLTDVTACASGNNALGRATRMIQWGDADVMFAGGTEAAVAKTPMAGLLPCMRSLPVNARRKKHPAPLMSVVTVSYSVKAAASSSLKNWNTQRKRGAHIYAEVIGYGTNGDAYHITAPRPGGELAARCMKNAIADAGISPEDIDYINAHGTSHRSQ